MLAEIHTLCKLLTKTFQSVIRSRSQLGEGMVQTYWKVLPYICGIFFRFCSIESLGQLKKIPTGYPPWVFFSKNWKSNFTPILNTWRITKVRFMKKFAKKNFKSFWVVIFEVSKCILNQKNFEIILCQKISFFLCQCHMIRFTL